MTFVWKIFTYLPQGNSDAILTTLTHLKPTFVQNQVKLGTKQTNFFKLVFGLLPTYLPLVTM